MLWQVGQVYTTQEITAGRLTALWSSSTERQEEERWSVLSPKAVLCWRPGLDDDKRRCHNENLSSSLWIQETDTVHFYVKLQTF